jgi:hypothetical protein
MQNNNDSTEAVEAAMKWASQTGDEHEQIRVLKRYRINNDEPGDVVARILAAEVERLRAELDRAEQKIEADRIARDHIIAKGVALERELDTILRMLDDARSILSGDCRDDPNVEDDWVTDCDALLARIAQL